MSRRPAGQFRPASLNLTFLSLCFASHLAVAKGAKPELVCGRVFLVAGSGVSFSDNEKSLVCGGGTWGAVPESQARYHLNVFLQARGYHSPTFESTPEGLLVKPGERQRASRVEFVGDAHGLSRRKVWTAAGEPLTPDLLDSVEAASVAHLKGEGFPCPAVEAEADPATGVIRAKIDAGKRLSILRVEEDPESTFPKGLFRRYDAFGPGDPFDPTALLLTSERIIREGTLESHYLTTECTEEGVIVRERVIAGPPRIVRLGFGLNTERLFMLRVGWQNTRLGTKASSLDLSAMLSRQEQELRALLAVRPFAPGSRFELRTLVSGKRQDEIPFEEVAGRVQVAPSYHWDAGKVGFRVTAGPTVNLVHTIRGAVPGEKRFVTWDGELGLISHSLELTPKSPIQGVQAAVSVAAAEKATLSPFSATRFGLATRALWNVGGFRPPKFIFGLRAEASTTFLSDPSERGLLTSRFLHYLGGTANLRGFARNEIPGGGGALSSIYLGAEMRFPSFLPWGLEPLLFFDSGAIGPGSLDLRAPVALSPGGGIRWESPIGTFRVTAARGFFAGGPGPVSPHFQFYLSYGEEF